MTGHSRPRMASLPLAYVPPAGPKPLRRGEGPAIHVIAAGRMPGLQNEITVERVNGPN